MIIIKISMIIINKNHDHKEKIRKLERHRSSECSFRTNSTADSKRSASHTHKEGAPHRGRDSIGQRHTNWRLFASHFHTMEKVTPSQMRLRLNCVTVHRFAWHCVLYEQESTYSAWNSPSHYLIIVFSEYSIEWGGKVGRQVSVCVCVCSRGSSSRPVPLVSLDWACLFINYLCHHPIYDYWLCQLILSRAMQTCQ